MFHVAPVSARASIREHGIDFRRDLGGGVFVTERKGNYLAANAQAAVRVRSMADFACDLGCGPEVRFDIWQVDTTGLALHPDPLDESGGEVSVLCDEPIPASRVQKITWKRLRELAAQSAPT